MTLKSALEIAFEKLGLVNGRLWPWQKTELVLEKFDVPRLGEELAAKVLCEIITTVHFPNDAISYRNVLRAESLLAEVLDINPDHEIHMDEVEIIENQFKRGESLEEVKNHFLSNQTTAKKPLS